MMAQDFHDSPAGVVAKVVTLANDLEDSSVKLLVQGGAARAARRSTHAVLNGRW